MIHELKRRTLKILPKKFAHKLLFYKYMKKRLNLKHPKTLNEKIQWMIIFLYGEKEGKLSDKCLVKKYVEALKISNLNIPKTLFTFENLDEFKKAEKLPDKYVLKTNHGSGDVYIINSETKEKIYTYINKLERSLLESYENNKLEYHYSYIKPTIMIEEYLTEESFERPLDYTFFCYDGYVDCVMVCSSRGKNIKKDFFNKNWEHLDYSKKELWSKTEIKCPPNINEMFEIASKISKGFPFVRVDLYNISGKIYFGEMTFTPAAGLSDSYTEEGDIHLGKYININKIKEDRKRVR